MHQLEPVHPGASVARQDTAARMPWGFCPPPARAGYSLIEVTLVLAIAAALAPPALGSAARLRASFILRQAQENAARLLAEARWTAIREGSAAVEFVADPPKGRVVSATGDTVMVADLAPGGVTLRLSGDRAASRVRYGPMGLGWVSSQTLRFAKAGEERAIVISSLGRVSRR